LAFFANRTKCSFTFSTFTMVYYNNTAEIDAAFRSMVGRYDYADVAHRPDSELALRLANLQPGASVLEIGAAGGRFIAAAKQRVGAGFCLAVDATRGFLDTDIPWLLHQRGLTVAPDGASNQQVHLLAANLTSPVFQGIMRNRWPQTPTHFDCIVALHVFTTMPAHERRQALVCLRQLLKPGTGRLIVNMTARFTDTLPLPAELNVPEQFRTTPHTECPGAQMMMMLSNGASVPTPLDPAGLPRKQVAVSVQVAPDRFWTISRGQATAAAVDAGLRVQVPFDVGKGDNFGLPAGNHSPPPGTVDRMSADQARQAIHPLVQVGRSNCVARLHERVWRLEAGQQAMSAATQDLSLTKHLQQATDEGARDTRATTVQGGVHRFFEWANVGTLLVLSR
jgi:SAM-dependent methyltransferase